MESKEIKTIKSFTDLNAWKEGHRLVLMIYKLTDNLPSEERYSLSDQMRRASVSITSNVAEGFCRQTYKEKCQFYSIARGLVTELQNQLLIARDVGYLPEVDFIGPSTQSILVHKIINGLLTKTRSFIKSKF